MAMRRLALQGSVRRLFTRLHRWSGLTLLVVLFIAAATVTVRRGGGSYKFTYDLHRALGVAFLPVWPVLGFTSLYLNFPGLVRAATMAVATVTAPDQAIATALARVPAARPFGVTRDFARSWYSVRLVPPGDVSPTGNSQVYVDFSTGEVVAARRASELRAGDRFIFWQFPLQSGGAFGLRAGSPSRWLRRR
jgi:uncharacterized iron-regulated membrane protein